MSTTATVAVPIRSAAGTSSSSVPVEVATVIVEPGVRPSTWVSTPSTTTVASLPVPPAPVSCRVAAAFPPVTEIVDDDPALEVARTRRPVSSIEAEAPAPAAASFEEISVASCSRV